ncbi:unnamed protein product [Paramecium sonneborni]|uniref:Uncharacterized protein n=1 Tax=Paramecium sonneborni TaxID=65129 RepID=A0A8S1NN03_9CILI|nr:unnamed protein product [Paramecium sonneborni]
MVYFIKIHNTLIQLIKLQYKNFQNKKKDQFHYVLTLFIIFFNKNIIQIPKYKQTKFKKKFQLDEETDQFIKQLSLKENLKYENLCTSTKQIELLPENFKQRNLILQDTRNSKLLLQVISHLENYSNKQEISNEIIKNIVLLLSNKEVKDKCLNLIKSNQLFLNIFSHFQQIIMKKIFKKHLFQLQLQKLDIN